MSVRRRDVRSDPERRREVRELDDRSLAGQLDGPVNRGVLVEREAGPEPMVVRDVLAQVAAQATLVPDDHVVEALAAEGADQAFGKRILPRRVGRHGDFLHVERAEGAAEDGRVDAVAIAEEEARRGVVRPGFAQLLRRPRGGGVGGHVDVDDVPAGVGKITNTHSTRKVAVGTVKKSQEAIRETWLASKVRQVWDDGPCWPRERARYLPTVA